MKYPQRKQASTNRTDSAEEQDSEGVLPYLLCLKDGVGAEVQAMLALACGRTK